MWMWIRTQEERPLFPPGLPPPLRPRDTYTLARFPQAPRLLLLYPLFIRTHTHTLTPHIPFPSHLHQYPQHSQCPNPSRHSSRVVGIGIRIFTPIRPKIGRGRGRGRGGREGI